MNTSTDLLSICGSHFRPYLELTKLAGESYYFRKESTKLVDASGNKRFWHPKIEHKMLRNFHCNSDELLYVALASSANLNSLNSEDLLYIGCSTGGGSRFWRGKIGERTKFPVPKSCFHHESMRTGRDGHTLESYLRSGGKVTLYTMTSVDVLRISGIHQISLPSGKYPAHQLERKILAAGFKKWKWNGRA